MKIKWSIFLLLLFSLACRRTAEPTHNVEESPLKEDEILSGGMRRHFILHVPASYAGNPVALILDFHGYNSNAQQEQSFTNLSAKADEAGFIVVYPDGLDETWYTGPIAQGEADRQFVRDLIGHIQSLYNIDSKRIYATGFSNGGGMTNRLACNLSDIIAAIAPNAGAYTFWEDCNPTRPVPVLAFHGLDDNVVPYDGLNPQATTPSIEGWAEEWAKRNNCATGPDITNLVDTVTVRTWSNCDENADVILYTLANHGHSWPGSANMPKNVTSQAINATDVMWEFFMSHPMP